MRLLLLLFVFLIVSSCKENASNNHHGVESVVVNDSVSDVLVKNEDGSITEIEPVTIPDIEGHYRLVKGYTKFHDGNIDTTFKGVLNISRVSENDFEIIRVDKYHEIRPLSEYKMIRFYKDVFYELNMCNEKSPAFTFQSQYHITQKDDNVIEIKEPMGNCDRYSTWKKVDPLEPMHLSLRKAYSNANEEYKESYATFISETTTDNVDVNVFFENGKLKIKHYHKNETPSYYVTHSFN